MIYCGYNFESVEVGFTSPWKLLSLSCLHGSKPCQNVAAPLAAGLEMVHRPTGIRVSEANLIEAIGAYSVEIHNKLKFNARMQELAGWN